MPLLPAVHWEYSTDYWGQRRVAHRCRVRSRHWRRPCHPRWQTRVPPEGPFLFVEFPSNYPPPYNPEGDFPYYHNPEADSDPYYPEVLQERLARDGRRNSPGARLDSGRRQQVCH